MNCAFQQRKTQNQSIAPISQNPDFFQTIKTENNNQ
jgi:hypothetical protein